MGWLAALSGFGPGYSQGTEGALRQSYLRQQLADQQRARQAQTLAGLALLRGGIPGFGGTAGGAAAGFAGPQPPMPGASSPPMTMPSAPPTPPPPAGPQVDPGSLTGQIIPGHPIVSPGTASIPPMGGTLGASYEPPAMRGTLDSPDLTPPAAPPATTQTLAPGPGIFAETLPPQQAAAPANTPAQPSPPPAADADTSQHVVATTPQGQFTIPQIFQSVDPQAIARAIAQASPGAKPDEVFAATEQLMKLANGNKAEQLQAAYVAKMLGMQMNIEAHHQDTATRVAATERGQDMSASNQAANRSSRENISSLNRQATAANLQTREKAIDARAALRRADEIWRATMQRGDRQTAARISTIRAQIAALAQKKDAAGILQPDDQKKLDELGAQLAAIGDALATQPAPAAPQQ